MNNRIALGMVALGIVAAAIGLSLVLPSRKSSVGPIEIAVGPIASVESTELQGDTERFAQEPIQSEDDRTTAESAEAVDESPEQNDGRVLLVDRANFRVYQVYDGCLEDFCLEYDNPYEQLSMTELKSLAINDATAAFQYAMRNFVAAETPADIERAQEYALRSVALASTEEVAWIYNGAVDHLELGLTSDPNVSDERIRESYIWMSAGTRLGLVDPRYEESARAAAEERDFDLSQLDSQAQDFALKLRDLRLSLTGERLDSRGGG